MKAACGSVGSSDHLPHVQTLAGIAARTQTRTQSQPTCGLTPVLSLMTSTLPGAQVMFTATTDRSDAIQESNYNVMGDHDMQWHFCISVLA